MGLTSGGARPGGLRTVSTFGLPGAADIVARYDFTREDGSLPIEDRSGNSNSLPNGAFTGVSASINGKQAGDFDGSNDGVNGSFGTVQGQPNHVFMVFQLRTTDNFRGIFDADANRHKIGTGSSVFDVFAGSQLTDGSSDTSPHVINVLFDGSNSKIRLDGTQKASGGLGAQDLDGVTLGQQAANAGVGANYADVKIGEVVVYQTDKTGQESEIEQFLADKWGITL